MAEGPIHFTKGESVEVDLRNIGLVKGLVVWTEGSRIGIKFLHPIDPILARRPVSRSAPSAAPAVKPPLTKRERTSRP